MKKNELIHILGKFLTIRYYPEKIPEMRSLIREGKIPWKVMVWLSSNQLVMPALYVHLRDAGLLSDLPAELPEYLARMHDLNLRRNQEILGQVASITSRLNSIGISPLFLKGTGHLLDGLYTDRGERMIGDIDFLLREEEIWPAVQLLKQDSYIPHADLDQETFLRMKAKHYPRLRNDHTPAAVEIHRQPVSASYEKFIYAAAIFAEAKTLPGPGSCFVPSDRHQVLINMIHAQLQDKAYAGYRIYLRPGYDFFLLSHRTPPTGVIREAAPGNRPFHAYVAVASWLFDHPQSLPRENDLPTRRYLKTLQFFYSHPAWHFRYRLIRYLFFRLKRYAAIPWIFLFDPPERNNILIHVRQPGWLKAHIGSWGKLGK